MVEDIFIIITKVKLEQEEVEGQDLHQDQKVAIIGELQELVAQKHTTHCMCIIILFQVEKVDGGTAKVAIVDMVITTEALQEALADGFISNIMINYIIYTLWR